MQFLLPETMEFFDFQLALALAAACVENMWGLGLGLWGLVRLSQLFLRL